MKTNNTIFCFLLFKLCCSSPSQTVIFDLAQDGGELYHFWKSTGFSPTNHFNRPLPNDVLLNLALIGALPHKGIEYVRIHWLLNLISFSDNDGKFDFKNLNHFIDWLKVQNLKLEFELMGKPRNLKEENITDIYMFWKNFIFKLLYNLLERYGYEEVINWRFETLNEPDLKSYNLYNFTVKEYLSYVRGCADGIRKAFSKENKSNLKEIKFGGPAGLFKDKNRHPLCWGFMDDCFNSNRNCWISYVSFHKKGDGSPENVLTKDIDLISNFTLTYGNRFKNISIANDEADILTNWSLSKEWRGDARYAAMMIKVIIDHFKRIVNKMKIKIEVLSNDNGFLNYHPFFFTQRTLLARFQLNNTNPPHIQFIQKPVYAAMGLLSLLENTFIQEKTYFNNTMNFQKNPHNANAISCTSILATKSNSYKNFRFSALIVLHETNDSCTLKRIFNIQIKNIPKIKSKYVIYAIDNTNSNPYLIWKTFGSPVFPSAQLFHKMREQEGPFFLKSPTDIGYKSNLQLKIEANHTSIYLLQICGYENQKPGTPKQLQSFKVYFGEVLLIWKDDDVKSKCVLSYEIEVEMICSDGQIISFVKCNVNPVLFLSFHYVRSTDNSTCHVIEERFRVRAVDYFNRSGDYSSVINLFSNK